MSISIRTEVEMNDIIKQIADLSENNVIDFIIKLDKEFADWDLTERLYEYFSEEIQKKDIEEMIACTMCGKQFHPITALAGDFQGSLRRYVNTEDKCFDCLQWLDSKINSFVEDIEIENKNRFCK